MSTTKRSTNANGAPVAGNTKIVNFRSSRRKTHPAAERPPFERIALILSGGGALGSYQAGVYEALAERNLHPDWVAGISIGAVNAAAKPFIPGFAWIALYWLTTCVLMLASHWVGVRLVGSWKSGPRRARSMSTGPRASSGRRMRPR